MKNILIVTGGSGGHVVPSTSLFEHLKNKFSVKMVSDLRGSKYINTEKFMFLKNIIVNLSWHMFIFNILFVVLWYFWIN